jgi:AraC-like DNA-binding protein
VLAKLSELLFVEAVRHYVETLPADRTGWLAGLRDPMVGRALALLHTQLAHGWTAEALAREVFLSRSAFAERFTAVIGVPPMKYLTTWRMQVAAQRLRESSRSVAQIAAERRLRIGSRVRAGIQAGVFDVPRAMAKATFGTLIPPHGIHDTYHCRIKREIATESVLLRERGALSNARQH